MISKHFQSYMGPANQNMKKINKKEDSYFLSIPILNTELWILAFTPFLSQSENPQEMLGKQHFEKLWFKCQRGNKANERSSLNKQSAV